MHNFRGNTHFFCLRCWGLGLLVISMWSLIWKLSVYTCFMDLRVDLTFFILPAGFISIPCIFLTLIIRKNKLKHILQFLALSLMAISLLFTGYFMGTIYQLHYSNETLRLSSTIPTEALNYTLYNIIIASYETSSENNTDMDKIQNKFRCCGVVSGTTDYVVVPSSCCPQDNCDVNDVYGYGCLRRVQEDALWHKNISLSISQLLLLMYVSRHSSINLFFCNNICFYNIYKFFNMAMVTSVSISDHYKWKNCYRDKIRQES
ncbi:uncharacterized protein [Euwallacea fornicatus]|uniref:uncharacterized protein isoform X2 n=1 Tax=Euwallacea fornicatus TaxID=995702 RepID=UPI00338EA905